jgi:integrase
LYITEVTDQRGQDIARGIEKNLLRFMEIVSDKPIDQYTVEDKLRYRDVLQRMPKCINRKEYQGMTIDEIVSADRPADELLSVKTVNMRLIEVATLFNWAVTNALVDSHPFKKAVLKIQKSDDAERPAVSDADIKVIIENLTRSVSEPSKFWIPLIACFTGMRQSEIAQLDGDDIVNLDGTWCIDVNDRGDKRLKNSNAKRIVPLHPVLVDAGLVPFAERRRGLKLFEDVKPYKGKYGHQVSKYFAKYLDSIGVSGDGQTFHGIRHSVITKLWAAGIPEAHTAAVVGHQRGERESYTRYAKKTDIGPLLAAVDAIYYGEIKLTAWSTK